jgi:hypothetical protein
MINKIVWHENYGYGKIVSCEKSLYVVEFTKGRLKLPFDELEFICM